MIELSEKIRLMNSTTKTKEKQAFIKDISDETKSLIKLTYDPFITFGIKKLPIILNKLGFTPEQEDLTPFYKMCDSLIVRDLSGNAARKRIEDVLSNYSDETSKTLQLVLTRDLQTNLATKNINKVHKKLIPEFTCKLAERINMDTYDWDASPYLAECKYDGQRALAQLKDDSLIFLSREGIPQPHLIGLVDEKLMILRKFYGRDVYIDGEFAAPTFTETMEAKKSGADKSKMDYIVFDIIPMDEWDAQECSLMQMERRKVLQEAVDHVNHIYVLEDEIEEATSPFEFSQKTPIHDNKLLMSEAKICHSRAEFEEFYDMLIERKEEGAVLKDMNAPYVWKRWRTWAKHTPVLTADLQVVGRYIGKPKSKNKNTLGGLHLEGYLEDGTFVQTDCGTGFSDDERARIWAMELDELLLLTAELEYREVSRSSKKPHPSLRFPAFKHFRTDK